MSFYFVGIKGPAHNIQVSVEQGSTVSYPSCSVLCKFQVPAALFLEEASYWHECLRRIPIELQIKSMFVSE